ncbi:MAG: hypothetical protein A3A57_01850 [Candidatus Woykebacteria bacterium RIFCSPLOWO2_01_FULL_41_12]|uniref:3D domain-containing protein n=1 Tax=Candidatus Woykebacteria bacterium RIFCSPLOWO2_01_FULL_41_12 TaxID=1802604 RepID=A0A1G1WTN9_9BACT|nr:MAG: hypothetical protein A3A57_01850 [Candidatus Woykebacteria bacterium RIFCSPLOWO2_01_FULL_41_12]
MKQGQATYYSVYRQEKVNLIVAGRNLFYILFGRISDKILALIIFSVFLFALTIYSTQSVGLKETFSRIDISNVPFFSATIHSPGSKNLRAEEAKMQSGINIPKNIAVIPLEELDYSRKLRVFATSYDKNCNGCNSTTATGLPTGYGVVAVDPKVIPLGTKLYIPGYGTAVAGDTGGNIKGNKIDLGFDNIKTGWWSSRFVDVYVLN